MLTCITSLLQFRHLHLNRNSGIFGLIFFSFLLKGADVSQTNRVNLIEDKKASSNFNKQRKSMNITLQTCHCLLVTLFIQARTHTHSSLRSSSVNIINNVYIGLLHRIPSQTFELHTSERCFGRWKTSRVFATLRLFI